MFCVSAFINCFKYYFRISATFFNTYLAGIIAFGIVVGCLFRGLYLLNEIRNGLEISPKKDKVQEAYENHLKERENENH